MTDAGGTGVDEGGEEARQGGAGADSAARVDHADPIETDAIAELGVDFAFRLTPDGVIEAVSGEVERLVGEPTEAVVGEGFHRYVADDHLEPALDAFQQVAAGEPVRGIALRLTGEGAPWVEVNAEPVREGSEVVAVRGAARAATERRRTIQRHSEAMEGALDGMALLGEDGHYRFVNEAHAELYGYDREELVGSHWSRLYDDDERRRLEEEALPTMEAEGSWRGEALGRRADGSTFRQELALSSLDEGFVCMVRDVTERHQREQIIDVLDRVLRHNLRNEMNVVLGEAETIVREGPDDASEAAGRIRDRARSLLSISETARTIREVVVSDATPRVRDLRTVVERARETFEADARITVSGPEEPLPVACLGVDHAVRELLENALAHGCPDTADADVDGGAGGDGTGGGTVRVELAETHAPGAPPMASLRVVDDGPGIPRMERLTLDEGVETPLRHGQGLGLWLVNWVATDAGGDLTVDERESGGAVEMRLPLADPDEE